MSFYITCGYHTKIDTDQKPDGTILLSSKFMKEQLTKRLDDNKKVLKRYPHLRCRLFDPQIYALDLIPSNNFQPCEKLASYDWLNDLLPNKQDFPNSHDFLREFSRAWLSLPLNNLDFISLLVDQIINFQIEIGCEAIILPGPLTKNSNTDFQQEMIWITKGLESIRSKNIDLPTYATLAISDLALTNEKPQENEFLLLVLDLISTSGVNGVYLIIEQNSEQANDRYLKNPNSLNAALFLVNNFSYVTNFEVIVNFFGPFGIFLKGIGANIWSTNWNKSLVRFRLNDQEGFAAYPRYWSSVSLFDVHLENDFDLINANKKLHLVRDITEFSSGLFLSASQGNPVSQIPDWNYSQNNTSYAKGHYQASMMKMNNYINSIDRLTLPQKLVDWITSASAAVSDISKILNNSDKLQVSHVHAWEAAVKSFIENQ